MAIEPVSVVKSVYVNAICSLDVPVVANRWVDPTPMLGFGKGGGVTDCDELGAGDAGGDGDGDGGDGDGGDGAEGGDDDDGDGEGGDDDGELHCIRVCTAATAVTCGRVSMAAASCMGSSVASRAMSSGVDRQRSSMR